MEREQTCCFTGHRPDKLPWHTDDGDARCLALRARIDEAVRRAYDAGCRHFICGMARGCDLYFCASALALRDQAPGVTVEAAVPCPDQADRWRVREREEYDRLLDRCDYESLVQPRYSPWCMMRRNRYMVDRSCRLIAVYNGVPKGGTYQTLAYAMQQELTCDIIPLE